MRRLLAALTLVASPAAADTLADLQGLYVWDTGEPAGSCEFVEYDDANFGIEGNTVQWIETTCELTNPTDYAACRKAHCMTPNAMVKATHGPSG